MTNPIPAAIYARYSTDRQDARSIDDQVRRCRVYAAAGNMEIVEIYSDAGLSGQSVERAELQRLLAAAEGRRCPFRAVLLDDLTRLSRDLGDTWSIIFTRLAGANVVVHDSASGMTSEDPSARQLFGLTALMSELMIESVRKQTHRGLEGRALAGFSTGGRCYGYRTVPELNPTDPRHPRALRQVDPEAAVVVRRIFELYASGISPRTIASALNAERLAAPYDRGEYTKPAGKGWAHTTIRALLRNERYIGLLTWNKRSWRRAGPQKRRRARLNDTRKVIRKERPDLRIIDDALWAKVRARFPGQRKLGTPRARAGYQTSPLSGLLHCGACGSRMSIAGQRQKAGRSYRSFVCSAHRSKGSEICPSSLTISEMKANSALSRALRDSLQHPSLLKRFEATFEVLWLEESKQRSANRSDHSDAEIRKVEAKVNRLMSLVEDGHGDVEALLDRVRGAEARLLELRAARVTVARSPTRPRMAPRPAAERLRALWEDLEGALIAAPDRARGELAALLTPVILTQREGKEGATIILKTEVKMTPAALLGRPAEVRSKVSCGDRI